MADLMTIECVECGGSGRKLLAAGATAGCEPCKGGGTIDVRAVQRNDCISLRQARPDECKAWNNGDHILRPDGTCRCGRRFLIVEVIE